MTTYNTGNPIGSTDARDLYDNAQNFDTAVNTSNPVWVDRFGVARQSLASAAGFVIDTPWLNAEDFTTLAEADAAAAAANKQLVISTVWDIAAATTLTSAIKVLPGGGFSGSGALTINGPFEAGLYQVFTGTNAVTFGSDSCHEVYPEWWGAKGDGVTDDTAAITASIAVSKVVKLAARTYICNITIASNGKQIEGVPGHFNTSGDPSSGTILKPYVGANPVISVNAGDPTDGIILRGLSFVGDGTGIGLRLQYVRHSVFENLNFHDFTTCIHAEQLNWMNNYTNIQMYWFSVAGFYLNNGSEDSQFINCLARGYQSASIGLKFNWYGQLNNFSSCDFSDNKTNVYIDISSDIGGNKPILTFDSCIFEQGSTEGQGFANSRGFIINAPYGSGRYTTVVINLNGCRFLYKDSTTLSSSKCFDLYGDGDITIKTVGTNLSNYPTAFNRISGNGYTRIEGSVIFIGTTLLANFSPGSTVTKLDILSPDAAIRLKSLNSSSGEALGNWNFTSGNLILDLSDIGVNSVVKLYFKINSQYAQAANYYAEYLIQEKGTNSNATVTEVLDVANNYSITTSGNTITVVSTSGTLPVAYKIVKII